MKEWSLTRSQIVAAPVSELWKYSVHPQYSCEAIDMYDGWEAISGDPGAEGSVVRLHLNAGKQTFECDVTTTKRIEFERIEQTVVTDGNVSYTVVEFEAIDLGTSKYTSTAIADMSEVPFWQRPLRKGMSKMMVAATTAEFVEYVERRVAEEMGGLITDGR